MASARTAGDDGLLTGRFMLLVAAHFLQALGYASMLLLPLYLEHLDASRAQIGAVMATSAVAGLATRPLVGWSLDRWGRKPTLIIGTLILSISMGMLFFVDRIGPLIYVERILVGVGIGALFSGYFTFAADLIPAARRTEGLALFGISGLVPLLINPFADRLHLTPSDLRWFLPVVGAVIFTSLLPLLVLAEPRGAELNARPMREALSELRRRALWPPWLATVAFSGLVAAFMTFATVAAAKRGVEDAPTLWLTYAIGAVLVRLFGARLPDRLGPSFVLGPALGLYIIAMLLAARATSLQDFLVAALLAGLGHGYCFPVLTSQVVTRIPDTFRGSAVSFFTALWGLSELLVSPAFGRFADLYGDGAMFHLAAGCGLACLLGWVGLERAYGVSAVAR